MVMVYFLLTFAAIIGLYGLYRFFMNASISQIKSFFLAFAALVMAVSLFYMAITGKLAAAVALVAAAFPISLAYMRERRRAKSTPPKNTTDDKMTRKKALEILGLKNNASDQDIEAAYKKLMKKIHPDQEGSEWLAAQINQAHDFLKGKK